MFTNNLTIAAVVAVVAALVVIVQVAACLRRRAAAGDLCVAVEAALRSHPQWSPRRQGKLRRALLAKEIPAALLEYRRSFKRWCSESGCMPDRAELEQLGTYAGNVMCIVFREVAAIADDDRGELMDRLTSFSVWPGIVKYFVGEEEALEGSLGRCQGSVKVLAEAYALPAVA